MLLVSNLLAWWYGAGWKDAARRIAVRIEGTLDYFSFGLLLKTLFAPYRQISAGSVDGPLEVKLRAMVDKLFSRVIGAFIRIILLIVGGATLAIQAIGSLIILLLWALVPLMPLAGIVAMMSGWVF